MATYTLFGITGNTGLPLIKALLSLPSDRVAKVIGDVNEIRIANAALAANVPRIIQIGMRPELVSSKNVNTH
eukprot:Awhi_evm1s10391